MDGHNIIGVGGLVIREGKVLLVRQNYGEFKGKWLLPGGHVDPGESPDDAAVREVWEETGVKARPLGIVAVRNRRISPAKTDIYIIFLMDYVEGEPRPDCAENTDARFFTPAELETCPDVTPVAQTVTRAVWQGEHRLLERMKAFPLDGPGYRLFL